MSAVPRHKKSSLIAKTLNKLASYLTLCALLAYFILPPKLGATAPPLKPGVTAPPPKPSAWLIGCLKESVDNDVAMDNCLVAFCSLLTTTDPDNVVVMVDELAKQHIGNLLEQQGAHIFVVPRINHHRIQRRLYIPSTRKRAVPMQLYAAKKYFAWTLTQFAKVIFVDGTDVVFLKNASRMLSDYEPFASIRDANPTVSKRCVDAPMGYMYLNAGIVLLKPDMSAFHSLMETYFRGNFTYCPNGSSVAYGNQEVIATFAFQIPGADGSRPLPVLGEFHEWPFCFNYRGWSDQSYCKNSRDMMLLHMPSGRWPRGMRDRYIRMARQGICAAPRRARSHLTLKPVLVPERWNYTLTT